MQVKINSFAAAPFLGVALIAGAIVIGTSWYLRGAARPAVNIRSETPLPVASTPSAPGAPPTLLVETPVPDPPTPAPAPSASEPETPLAQAD
jgi:hypothetical protein